jgi:hypothetical protein
MKIKSKDFRERPGAKVKLKEWPMKVKPFCKSKKQYKKLLEAHVEELSALQQLHYASNRYALLLIFQGMDAAGKDGAIRLVMSGSIRKAARFSVSNSRPPTSWNMIFSGAQTAICRNAGGSAFSTVPIMRRCWSFGCIQRYSVVRGFRKSCATRKPSGRKGIAPSWIWKIISNATPARSSNFSSIYRKTNNENDSSNALMSRTRTGNSASPTFMSGNTGSIT